MSSHVGRFQVTGAWGSQAMSTCEYLSVLCELISGYRGCLWGGGAIGDAICEYLLERVSTL